MKVKSFVQIYAVTFVLHTVVMVILGSGTSQKVKIIVLCATQASNVVQVVFVRYKHATPLITLLPRPLLLFWSSCFCLQRRLLS